MSRVCPLIQAECLAHSCEWYTHVLGADPQTGVEQDRWGCAVGFLPLLLVQTAGETRAATQTIDKFRNGTVEGFRGIGQVLQLAVENNANSASGQRRVRRS